MHEPQNHARGIVGVNGGKHNVASQCRLDCQLGRFFVSNLAHHDDIGILTNQRTETAREVETDLRFHLRLIDMGNIVFDRIFERSYVVCKRIE